MNTLQNWLLLGSTLVFCKNNSTLSLGLLLQSLLYTKDTEQNKHFRGVASLAYNMNKESLSFLLMVERALLGPFEGKLARVLEKFLVRTLRVLSLH
eukprot:CAMPEP_0202427670 /NCGR_PEP_ID=MMETSP1345-20130828/1837_1 /ASSEMBLY_ACC=CAM_ASM_000843 /TAXON_ID=342563 /ORGANISM="Fabrea Fabrea salina" /LENGTH=95 /DNA_ID=CAMNT_0049038441 /DNA_START=57 /DNA_END=344 /DNA_ORIENTATION=-